VLFGSLAIVAVYLCGLALFAAQGPAIAASLLAFFNQMLFVQSRIAMLDIFALAFSLFAIAAFMQAFETAAASVVRACRDRLRPVDRLQMERAVRARGLHRHRR
jgi:asparagine N-glycosylation enzyme membrane subunit Stt3